MGTPAVAPLPIWAFGSISACTGETRECNGARILHSEGEMTTKTIQGLASRSVPSIPNLYTSACALTLGSVRNASQLCVLLQIAVLIGLAEFN